MDDPFVVDRPERAKAARRAHEAKQASEAPPTEVPADVHPHAFLAKIIKAFRQELEDVRKLWSAQQDARESAKT